MNKTLFFCLIFSLLLISCKQKSENNLFESNSALNTISVIIDDNLWDSEVGDSIRNKFASPVLGLPQEEPMFTIQQYPAKLFEGFSTGTRNIIIVKKTNESRYELKVNEYTNPQNAFHISGKSTREIITMLEKHALEMVDRMHKTEIKEFQKKISDSLLSYNVIRKRFPMMLKIPADYETVISKKNFIWLKKEIISGNLSLLIYKIPKEKWHLKDVVSGVIQLRDSIGRKYIHAKGRNTNMITEEAYSPYFGETSVNGLEGYETKGTWQMTNDFMSGPFINYVVHHPQTGACYILEGFCYAPSKNKRDLMFELEAIIKSLQFIKQ